MVERHNLLTHWGPVTPYSDNELGQHLAHAMSCCLMAPRHFRNQWLSVAITREQLDTKCLRYQLVKMSLKSICVKLPPHVAEANELMGKITHPDSKVYGANTGPTWGRQDPGRPRVSPMNLAICVELCAVIWSLFFTRTFLDFIAS